jgi:YidC/Oxa1 family membrane protein insertase
MNNDSKNGMIGMMLIMVILMLWNYWSMPSATQLAENKRKQDSIAQVQHFNDSLANAKAQNPQNNVQNPAVVGQVTHSEYGILAPFASGTEQDVVLENSEMKVTFTNKGGRIKDVLMKKHFKIWEDDKRQEHKDPLRLFEDIKNRFEWRIPTNTIKGKVTTQDLYFTPSVSGNTIVFSARVNDQTYIEQKYVISGTYDINYDAQIKGFGQILASDAKNVELNVENYMDKLEKNVSYESGYSNVYYRENNETPNSLSATSVDSKTWQGQSVQWVSHANQFFNTALICNNGSFPSTVIGSEPYDKTSSDLKKAITTIGYPLSNGEVSASMKLYIGPNDYGDLKKYGIKLEDVVSYGGSILGTINRYVIRPIFDFLHGIFPNVAICILLLTFIVKAILYPLSYKMLYSQAKMTSLKPDLEKMKAKLKDPQEAQMAQMKMYQEYGVNPLGGCLPTVLQMPIWMALFRFFPASIDFRQQSFLWATDLTGFEEFIKLPFPIPLYGAHISLFALLWGLSLIVFTWYSMKDVDMSGQPAMMKNLQYFTPIIFMVMFNSYAAGLSLYMLFSNILNIGQTVVTKNYIIDHEKVRAELQQNKAKPKKPGIFRQKLDEAMKQQQAMKEEQEKKSKNKK